MVKTNQKVIDAGLLLMRVGLGIMFLMHGYPKLNGGPALWEKIGQAMGTVGVSFFPVFWGFMAAISEFFGGILLIMGLFFRPACGFLAFTMTIASIMLTSQKAGFNTTSYPETLLIIFIGLFVTGPGSYTVRTLLKNKNCGCGCTK